MKEERTQKSRRGTIWHALVESRCATKIYRCLMQGEAEQELTQLVLSQSHCRNGNTGTQDVLSELEFQVA